MTLIGKVYRINDILYMIYDEKDLIQRHIVNGNQWEPELTRMITELGNKIVNKRGKAHLVNVGAHIGTVCIPCSRSFTKVTAFEPVPQNFEHLKMHARLNNSENISVHNLALSDCQRDASVVFHTENTGGTHVVTEEDIKNNVRHASASSGKTVKCVSLDSISFEDSIDVLLVDIEGHEDKFIEGARNTISSQKPILIIEIWTNIKRKYENMSRSQEEMISIIKGLGYESVNKISDDTFIFH